MTNRGNNAALNFSSTRLAASCCPPCREWLRPFLANPFWAQINVLVVSPERVGAEGWAPRTQKSRGPNDGGPKFRFCPSPTTIFFLFTRQPENSKRAHLIPLALQTPPKFHEEDQKRRKKRKKIGAGEGKKKREILGPPTLRGPTLLAPTSSWFGRGLTVRAKVVLAAAVLA